MSAGRLGVDVAARGLVAFRVEIDPREVVFVKSVVEASEGLASIFAESGGSLTIASPPSRRAALVELLDDLVAHHGAYVEPSPQACEGGRS
jgi:hypothetical protein